MKAKKATKKTTKKKTTTAGGKGKGSPAPSKGSGVVRDIPKGDAKMKDILAIRHRVSATALELAEASARAKKARKEYDSTIDQLLRAIDNDEHLPLYDEPRTPHGIAAKKAADKSKAQKIADQAKNAAKKPSSAKKKTATKATRGTRR